MKKRSPQASILVEQPQDPQGWKRDAEAETPSFLCWEEVRQFQKDLGLAEVRLEQRSP